VELLLQAETHKRLRRLLSQDVAAKLNLSIRDAGLKSGDVERVVELIRSDASIRDVGAIAYLATSFDRIPPAASSAEIAAQSRADAADYAQALAHETPQAGSVLKAVAVTTEAGVGVAKRELAFVLSDNDDKPSLGGLKNSGLVIDDTPQPLTYRIAPTLNDVATRAEETLRRRRVLEEQTGRVNFVHPYHRAGAQAIFRPDLPEDMKEAIALTERALTVIDPEVSLAAARNLS
jgi:hypothetical protein